MRVLVKLSEPIWRTVGQRRVEVELDRDKGTVADVLRSLEERYPAFGQELCDEAGRHPRLHYSLFLNNALVRQEQAATTPVQDGDTLYVILPMAGGERP